MVMNSALADFCERMPKVELHAHLHGSITDKTLLKMLNNIEDVEERQQAERTLKDRSRNISQCFSVFDICHKIVKSTEVLHQITNQVLDDFELDNVKYLELRTTPRANPATGMTVESYVTTLTNTVETYNLKDLGMTVRLLLSIDRRGTLEDAMKVVDLAYEYRDRYVVGIDFCGNPTVATFEDKIPAFDKARQLGLKISLHCAEIPKESGTDAILAFRPDRLGHCCCLSPQQLKSLEENPIPIEVCVSSNLSAGGVPTINHHVFGHLYPLKYPIAISSDDKGVFRSPLSNEYHKLAKAFQLSPKQLWSLSCDTINYVFEDEDIKDLLREQFEMLKPYEFVDHTEPMVK
eukprot:GFYU01009302.1.p1 GENE.GFYU01009302.1~~GFYU01009302.1.p1  ORF type:complete len:349 (-),score=56.91 GFYU01009302.1:130-1176(-)